MPDITVHFLPYDKKITAPAGSSLIDIAMDAGIHINASCGGEGTCGKCLVQITSGSVTCKDQGRISQADYEKGYRPACKSIVKSDITVMIPEGSRIEETAEKTTLRPKHAVRNIVLKVVEDLISDARLNPALKKYAVAIEPPTLSDNTSDLSRLLRALKQQKGLENISIDFLLLQKLSTIMRQADWNVTVTVVQTRMESQLSQHQLHGSRRPKMITVEAGDTTGRHYSVVLDIGTTSLWGRLVDLNSRETLAEASVYNPQIRFGDDVITRIIFSQKPDGLTRLQEAVVSGINTIIGELIEKSGIDRQHISHITAAGNTVMTHLLVGLDPKYIREAPYTPVGNFFPPIRAVRIGLDISDYVYLYTFPMVASYVGGDIVSGVLSSRMYNNDKLTLFIDIGTNGEIVVGNQEWLMTASCSAGPAFEGGGLKCGMRATDGAIERFHLNPDTFEPMIVTIGKVKARGICGSGAISILAEFLENGVLDQNGKFNRSCKTDRIQSSIDGAEYILTFAQESGTGKEVVITESDIDNLMRAKAAMFAGCQCLLEKVGLTFSDLEQIIIAGAFGDFIDLEEAITIGLLPEIPIEHYQFIGNGSLLGAKLISLSNELLDDGERIARKMMNVELSDDHGFMDNYMAGMFLPHTDHKLFPEVTRRLKAGK
ncbi:MAG: DUF4445 domain-containing protein [Deltaproteobacteria bacterium]|nr:DUF4445 domain-containing protein [Deltaproteobacteria bacterium]